MVWALRNDLFSHCLSEKYSNVVFLEVHIHDRILLQSVKSNSWQPYSFFFKKEKKVDEFSGSNKEKLEATMNELI